MFWLWLQNLLEINGPWPMNDLTRELDRLEEGLRGCYCKKAGQDYFLWHDDFRSYRLIGEGGPLLPEIRVVLPNQGCRNSVRFNEAILNNPDDWAMVCESLRVLTSWRNEAYRKEWGVSILEAEY